MFNFFKRNSKETQNPEQEKKHSFWKISLDNLKKTISNTKENLIDNAVSIAAEEEEFTDYLLDDMEELLIKADLGVNLASSITDKLRGQSKIKPSEVKQFLKEEFRQILNSAGSYELNTSKKGFFELIFQCSHYL